MAAAGVALLEAEELDFGLDAFEETHFGWMCVLCVRMCVCVGVAFVLVCCVVRESEECMVECVGVACPGYDVDTNN